MKEKFYDSYYMNHCFRCNKQIEGKDKYAFTREFDSFICEDCYAKIMNKDFDEHDGEAKIIYREWN